MARKFDPNNLTAGDVFRAITPFVAAIGVIYLVNKHFPNLVGLVVVALITLVFFGIWSLPRKDVVAMTGIERKRNEKIKAVPLIGPALAILRQALDWLSMIIALIMLVGLVYWAVGAAF